MAGEIYSLLVPPSGATFVAGHTARVQQIECIRQCIVVLAKPRLIPCGGNDKDLHDATSWERLRNTIPLQLCEEDYRGFTFVARIRVRVTNASGTVDVRLFNTDDASVVAQLSAPITAVTLTDYEVDVTLPPGLIRKNCEWQIEVSNGDYPGAVASVALEYGL